MRLDPIEIRQYGPRLAAEADMGPGPDVEAEQEAAFMALAAFIFGQNRQGPVVAMTAPVSVAASDRANRDDGPGGDGAR